jgi:hypothetical protein
MCISTCSFSTLPVHKVASLITDSHRMEVSQHHLLDYYGMFRSTKFGQKPCNKTLGLIRRSTLEITDTNARSLLYLQLVRSNFSYATQAWCPQSVKLIEDIEKVQRRATKHILNLGFITDISYKTRLLSLTYYLSHIGTSTWIWCSSPRSLTISHTLTNVLCRSWLDQESREVNQTQT